MAKSNNWPLRYIMNTQFWGSVNYIVTYLTVDCREAGSGVVSFVEFIYCASMCSTCALYVICNLVTCVLLDSHPPLAVA
ncbi:hypothetical protein V1525DRAFT_403061 [Lipomyces kononenkoae]|uniref:Uncharacterized protein n=1 Tax=Lipomyces kononenkoae TaxID=34357 RepID=A0ACC3T1R0_LIPKO